MMRGIVFAACFAAWFPATALAAGSHGLHAVAGELPLVSQSVHVRIDGDEAELYVVQEFHNPGETAEVANYRLYVPEEGQVTGFGFWRDGRYLEGVLQARDEAEAAHDEAIGEGRATGLLHADGGGLFEVRPVYGGAMQRVDVTLRVPVEMARGRRSVHVPVEGLLDGAPVASVVTVDVATARQLSGFGGVDEHVVVMAEDERSATFAWSGGRDLDVWWQEEAPPIDVMAQAVELEEGDLGVAVTVSIQELAEPGTGREALALLLDVSRSMRHRGAAVASLVEHLRSSSDLPVEVYAVAGGPSRVDPDGLDAVWGRGDTRWRDFERAREALDCGGTKACTVFTDPQLPGLDDAVVDGGELVLFAEGFELAYFESTVRHASLVHRIDKDSPGRLRGLADRIGRPTASLADVSDAEGPLRGLSTAPVVIAEGSFETWYARTPGLGDEVDIELMLPTGPRVVTVPVELPNSSDAQAVRRRVYGAQIRAWEHAWREDEASVSRDDIVAVSLREGVPSMFTAFQVDDPELSLFSIKPGDPLLTFDARPGTEGVAAWYPFGDLVRLVPDSDGRTFTDRFLVPRHWSERAYRVDLVELAADGSRRDEGVWYVLDDTAPEARVERAPGGAMIVVEPDEVAEITSSAGHVRPGPDRRRWYVPVLEGESVAVFVRDRAGNRSGFDVALRDGALAVASHPHAPASPVEARGMDVLFAEGVGLRVDDGFAVATWGEERLEIPLADVPLRSMQVSSTWSNDDAALLGTRGGDIAWFERVGREWSFRALWQGPEDHPVTGFGLRADGAWWVGVLGKGLYELTTCGLSPSTMDVGSKFVTAVLRERPSDPTSDLLVATAYNGLWRIVGDRAIQSRFPQTLVTDLEWVDGELIVRSGPEAWHREGRDRFRRLQSGWNAVSSVDRSYTDAVSWRGEVWTAGFDSGLWRGVGEALEPVVLGLSPAERRINALAVYDGLLWMATEGGVLSWREGRSVRRWTDSPAADLHTADDRLLVAAKDGLWTVSDVATRWPGSLPRGAMSVVDWRGMTLVGTMDGVYQAVEGGYAAWSVDAHYVTDLLVTGDTLWVSTYGSGVMRAVGGSLEPVPGLSDQWVPPNGLSVVDGQVWAGGVGMPAARIGGVAVERWDVPLRDVHKVFGLADGTLWVLGSDGRVVGHTPHLEARR